MDPIGKISGFLVGGYQTLAAKVKGPCKNFTEMQLAQHDRYKASAGFLCTTKFDEKKIAARKQYWTAQTFFLNHILGEIKDKSEFTTYLIDLKQRLSKGEVDTFLDLLNKHNELPKNQPTPRQSTSSQDLHRAEVTFYQGDVTHLMNQLAAEGYHIVIDDAPNSNRDGCAKYASGSVEEVISRYTNAWQMVLHFEDVHQRNTDKQMTSLTGVPPKINVETYQARYLLMMLDIVINFLHGGEAYLESPQFLKDLFESYPSEITGIPIYFDMQNNAYEVPIEGFVSTRGFFNTEALTSVDAVFEKHQNRTPVVPVTVVSYAAPDQRVLESTPLDKRCTSNTWLQRYEVNESLTTMLENGIKMQCEKAIELAQQDLGKPVAAVFIMPGCGAFGNPEDLTTTIFFNAIGKYYPDLNKNQISCYVAERNSKLVSKMTLSLAADIPRHIEHEPAKSSTFDLSNRLIELRLQDLDLNAINKSDRVTLILPDTLSSQSKRALSASGSGSKAPISIHLKKKKDIGQSNDVAEYLKQIYSSGLLRIPKDAQEVHFILMGTGYLGYSVQESMQGFMMAVDEMDKLDISLPRLIMHIRENMGDDFDLCNNLLAKTATRKY